MIKKAIMAITPIKESIANCHSILNKCIVAYLEIINENKVERKIVNVYKIENS